MENTTKGKVPIKIGTEVLADIPRTKNKANAQIAIIKNNSFLFLLYKQIFIFKFFNHKNIPRPENNM